MTPMESTRPSARSEILAVARRLFMTRGFRAVTTREIADIVGLTQPALYHHFGGKEALYIAVLEDDLARQSTLIRSSVYANSPARDRLAALAMSMAEQIDHDLGQMFHDLRFEVSAESRDRIVQAFREAMMEPMLDLVDALVTDGDIPPPEDRNMTRAEIALFALSIIRMLKDSSGGPARGIRRTPPEIGAMTVRLLLSGVGRWPETR
jgi:AcrR family transcriptional regulator